MREYGVATPFAHSCVVWCEYLTDFHHGGRGLAGRVNARLAAQFVWQRIYASVALLAPNADHHSRHRAATPTVQLGLGHLWASARLLCDHRACADTARAAECA